MAAQRGINARSCGSNFNYALVPCSANLIAWADKIICVNEENLHQLEDNFLGHQHLLDAIEEKAITLDIPDNYEYMDPQLQQHFLEQLFEPHGPVTQ